MKKSTLISCAALALGIALTAMATPYTLIVGLPLCVAASVQLSKEEVNND